jgi:ABC-2 type transport system permease protein
VLYGLVRTTVVLVILAFYFHLSAPMSAFLPVLALVVLGSLSFVGLGIMAATLPLLFTEKGAQMTYVIEACLLLVSGVYFNVSVLPAWLQPLSYLSPATYILRGIRSALGVGGTTSGLIDNIIPLVIIGGLTVPLGIWLFTAAQRFAKRTGRLKRTG